MSRRLWIVWLLLALLPLRGWAAASMTVTAAKPHAAMSIDSAAESTQASVPPCHEGAGDDADSVGHACNLCDLCHGAVADLADATLPSSPAPAVKPLPAVVRDTGRHAVGGLERPPRTLRA